MTGLDQDMMQKNLTCKNIKDAQKNMFWFSISWCLSIYCSCRWARLLYLYSDIMQIGLPEKSDNLYPMLAMDGQLGTLLPIVFISGLIAAAYSSADSALTALTTSFCIDIIEVGKNYPENKKQVNSRKCVHLGMSVIMFLSIVIFRHLNNESVIKELFTIAGYTYGPLLGLYSFGMFTKFQVHDKFLPIICIASPLICFILNQNSVAWMGGYKFGFELLLLNGMITFLGLALLKR